MMLKMYVPLIAATCIVSIYAIDYGYDYDNVFDGYRQRIIEGIVPTNHPLPFLVFISVGRDLLSTCTGTILSPRYVLTALSCFSVAAQRLKITTREAERLMVVRAGSQYRYEGLPYSVASSYITSKTSKNKAFDDIMILKLNRDIVFDYLTTAPVTLVRWKPKLGETVAIAGYGVHVTGAEPNYKTKSYVIGNTTVMKNDRYCKPKKSYEFCAGGINQGRSDGGDRGGPVMKKINGKYVQVGMILEGKTIHNPGNRFSTLFDVQDSGLYLTIDFFCDMIQRYTDGAAYCKKIRI
uniref:Peptidase S1 domain-containing protein n=1 Tax=Panagrellus redivivus TaxID=6233 RepID=A0A7E4V735_PANRE